MSWVRLDDQFHNHPKVALLGWLQLPAIGLHVLALCWCNNYLTDGFIPAGQIDKLCGDLGPLLPMGTADPVVGALVDAGLWEELEDGYQIHDYLDYQPSRYEVLKARAALSKERSKAGSKGAANREAKRKQNVSKPPSKAHAPYPHPNPGPTGLIQTTSEQKTGGPSLDNGARARGGAPPQKGKQLTEEYMAVLVGRFPGVDVAREREKYEDYNLMTARPVKDHMAGFRNWLRKAEDDGKRLQAPGRLAFGRNSEGSSRDELLAGYKRYAANQD